MSPEEKLALIDDVVCAVRSAIPPPHLSEEETRWVRLAIKREAQSVAFRQSIIDKTMTALLWSFLLGVGKLIYDGLKFGGWRT